MNKKMGFTLVELLTVVMIIAVLTAIAVPQYRRSIQRAQAGEALTNLRTIFEASTRYRAEHSTFPTNVRVLDVGFFDALAVGDHASAIGEFLYTFGEDSISACRLDGNSNPPTADNTYCFEVFYNEPEYGGRGAMICYANSKKYENVCPAFGEPNEFDVIPAELGYDSRPYQLDKIKEDEKPEITPRF